MPATSKIGLYGLFGCGNIGNDGSLEAVLSFLRRMRPDAELVCICADPDLVRREYGLAALPIKWPRAASGLFRTLNRLLLKVPGRLIDLIHAVMQMRDIDVLIMPGTGILDDYGEPPWGMPYTIFSSCLAARLRGVRIAFLSVGAGPINHPLSRWLMKAAAGMATYRSYRDAVSKDFMDSIGFDTRNDAIYPDVALKLPSPPSTHLQRRDGNLTVGVGVMAYYGWRADPNRGAMIYNVYLKKLTQFVLWLLDQGHHVRVLVGETTDHRAVDDMMTMLRAERKALPPDRVIANPIQSLHDLMREISETDVVVATRFHNIVCALKLGRPTISLGYAKKNDVLMTEMGLEEFCQHVEQVDLDWLIEQFAALTANREKCERTIREVNVSFQKRLRHQEELLLSGVLAAADRAASTCEEPCLAP
jgi:polysaccharide pyruvyl transferase WcaK-like protein